MKTLIAPHVHLNGSSQESLCNAYIDAVTALGKALEALHETAPHARDYYLSVTYTNRFEQAQLQHSERVAHLRTVQAELHALAVAVDERRDSAELIDVNQKAT